MTIPALITHLNPSRAAMLVKRLPDVPVLIIGDTMLDHFIIGSVHRLSPEAPVPVVEFREDTYRLGGAANVAQNVAALGARPSIVGVIGEDDAGGRLRAILESVGADVSGLLTCAGRKTTVKTRVVTERHQQIARIDYETAEDVDAPTENRLIHAMRRAVNDAGVAVISDYVKGVATRAVCQALITDCRPRRPVIVDPKVPHITDYAGATVIKPNQLEAETATQGRVRTDNEARLAARALKVATDCENVIITRGREGMWLLGDEYEGGIRATAGEVVDVTGAGDTVTAVLALALGAGASLIEATVLANVAAGIVVRKFGAATVTPDELLGAILSPSLAAV
jgi:D-beta-D-heptose 7-phosphate kinase/D-beta-D-heptose 1-phosphate adenosyltransferase